MVSSEQLAASCDVVVECAAPAAFESIAWPAIRQGKTLLVLTATRLLANLEEMQVSAATHLLACCLCLASQPWASVPTATATICLLIESVCFT